MRYRRTLLPLGAAALLIGFILLGAVYCQDKPAVSRPSTVLSRLKEFAFVGVTYDERNTSMALHAMTEEQRDAYLAAREKSAEFYREKSERRRAFKVKISDARARREPAEEIAKIQPEVDNEYVERSTYHSFGSDVHRVIGVGSDYVEIEYLHQPGMTEIIPLSEIRRVIFRSDLPVFEVETVE